MNPWLYVGALVLFAIALVGVVVHMEKRFKSFRDQANSLGEKVESLTVQLVSVRPAPTPVDPVDEARALALQEAKDKLAALG